MSDQHLQPWSWNANTIRNSNRSKCLLRRSFDNLSRKAGLRARFHEPDQPWIGLEVIESRILLSADPWVFGVGDAIGADIAADGSGNIYVAGHFGASGEISDFDPGPGTAELTSAGKGKRERGDGYIAKYADGNFEWVRRMGSPKAGQEDVSGIAVDQTGNNIYIVGIFQNTADFGPFSLTSSGRSGAFWKP